MGSRVAARWVGASLCAAGMLHAEVITDGSLGAAGALPGPAFQIPAGLGKKAGANLFHSFSKLNLGSGESATFSGPADVQHIFARVTGGTASSIDGMLRSTISGANFYFLNPKGVLFGPNASIDVSGSFAVVTGDHIALSDGTRFNATPGPDDATLTSAPPAAFGFLPANAGPIEFQGTTLTAAAGTTLSFIGGAVQMTNATLNTNSVVIRGGRLVMDNSRIAATLQTPDHRVDIKLQQSLAMTAGSTIQADAVGPVASDAVVDIAAPQMALSGFSSITSNATDVTRGANIRITADTLDLSAGAHVDALTFAPGEGGDIDVIGRDVTVRDFGTGITALAIAGGLGGNVRLTLTGQLFLTEGAVIQTSTFGPARAGNIAIVAQNVTATGGSSLTTGIIADSSPDATGAAGDVALTVVQHLELAAGARLSSDTFGSGAGGTVSVSAASASILGGGVAAFTAISTETQSPLGGGPGGMIRLRIGGPLVITGGGQITATTTGSGSGGGIDIAAGSVFISGAGAIAFPGIAARTLNTTVGGASGDVRMSVAGLLDLVAGGKIAVSTGGTGAGGSADITAGEISVSGDTSQITAATSAALNGGAGGNLTIHTPLLRVSDLGKISASTAGPGAGGSLDITAQHLVLNNGIITADTTAPATVELPFLVSGLIVTLDIDHTEDQNLDVVLRSYDGRAIHLFTGVGGTGQNFFGTVLDDSAPVSIFDGAAPFTGTFQPAAPLSSFDGIAFNGIWQLDINDINPLGFVTDTVTLNSWSLAVGGITVSSPNVPVSLPGPLGSSNNFSTLTVSLPPIGTAPVIAGHGGDVRITANDLTLLGGSRISARTLDASPGGSVSLSVADQLQIKDGSAITANTLGAGRGGNVSVSAGKLLVANGGTLSAGTAGLGDGGDVQVRAGSVKITAGSSTQPTLISAESTATGPGGRGGDVLIDATSLRIDGRRGVETGVSAKSQGLGASGSITLRLSTLDMDSYATVGSSNTGDGTAGSVAIRAHRGIELSHRSLITTSAAQGDAGNIAITSDASIYLNSHSSITASAGSNGGSIRIIARDILFLTDSSITATAGSVQLATGAGGGAGGNIFIDPKFIILDHSLISANAAIGQGGNILLIADNFLPSESLITATGSTAGTVQITAPPLDLANALAALQASFVDISTRLQERCAMRLGQEFSSFLVVGRSGVEESPDEPQTEVSPRVRKKGKGSVRAR